MSFSSSSSPLLLLSSLSPFSLPPSRLSISSSSSLSPPQRRYLRTSPALPHRIVPRRSRHPKSCMARQEPPIPLSQELLEYARAYWVEKDLIAWDIDVNIANQQPSLFLYSSRNANLFISNEGIQGYDVKIALEPNQCGLPLNVTQKYPHISKYKAFKLPNDINVPQLLKTQLAIASFNLNGICENATSIQIHGVLDDLFSYNGPLGPTFNNNDNTISLHLWAPTAQEVNLCLYEELKNGDLNMKKLKMEERNGVWEIEGPMNWEGKYYNYEIIVFHMSTLNVEICMANDPYARSVSADGERTLLINMKKEELKPEGWNELRNKKPVLNSFADISIYELHIRDFSIYDRRVEPEFRGKYLAFTSQDSNGINHLKKLCEAGLTHVHLLPSFYFGDVDDISNHWKTYHEAEMEKFPPDSDKQQEIINAIKDQDGYNWGYNPVLWGVPKGSYSTDPNGSSRIIEFRKMVQGLNKIGLRVILDVVYNHLFSSGPFDKYSVLDKIVPGYYLRLNKDGKIENSACVNNTASENFMVERLILDDLLSWAINYKVDGFRFDLMGHIMKGTMVKAKLMLESLTEDENGIDGSKIYLYGEGWDFGEVAKNQRGINASQLNISGTGIGSFNDRIRDAINGGSPFGNPLQQGFATGLSLQPNGFDQGDKFNTNKMLAISTDYIQVGLAGNLKDFVLTTHTGQPKKGSEILTHDGWPVGYVSSPIETINYVSAHDNETLFDIISIKTPYDLSINERCRINHFSSSLIALSQGIPFFHAGDEILRSKSLDRDSYNSGDWFNKVDFSYETNNWGIGLPPKEKNESNWPLMKPRLANPLFKPNKKHILMTFENFINLLKIRYSSPLFRLQSSDSIQERVRFYNTGPNSVPGVIVMSIEDGFENKPGISQLDPNFSFVVVVFNASPNEVCIEIPALKFKALELHPLQLNSTDDLVKESKYDDEFGGFIVPKRITSVFVQLR